MTPDTADPQAARSGLPDGAVAALLGAVSFVLYAWTMFPGLHDLGDAAKFSFVGKVLGTPHEPGYPLYIMVSHVFSYLPWGTLAHRMNGLSALMGAVAVALVYLGSRRAGAGQPAAAAMALACGLGDAFWAKSQYAKGYTLNAALVAGGVLALLRWDATRTSRGFLAAVAVFAVAIGNHLTIVALLPALALFALLTDWRTVLRPRTLLAAALIVLLGFTQYGLILIRTAQHAPYLEAKATNLTELWSVMTARRFAHEIGAFSWPVLLSKRVPLVGSLIWREVGLVGACVTLAGLVWLARRRPRVALLLALGACGVAALTANMGSSEDEGFLLSVFVLLAVAGSVGLDWILGVVRRAQPASAAGIVAVACLLPPGVQLASNFASHDHRADTIEIEYFDALFAALPPKAAIVTEDYRVEMMVQYKLLGEQAAGTRDITTIPADPAVVAQHFAEGREVLAFPAGRQRLTDTGVRLVPFAPFMKETGPRLTGHRPVYRVDSVGLCRQVGNLGWLDLTQLAQPLGRIRVKIDDFHPFESSVTIYAATDAAIEPVLIEPGGAGSSAMTVESFVRGSSNAASRLAARASTDGLALPPELLTAPFVARIEVRANDKGAYTFYTVDLGARPTAIRGRAIVDRSEAFRATICSHELAASDAWPANAMRVLIDADSSKVVFGAGWYPVERRADGQAFHWTTDEAQLIIPITSPRDATLRVSEEPFGYPGRRPGAVELLVNGHTAGVQPLADGSGSLVWTVPRSAWRSGLNAVVLRVNGATSPSAAGVSADKRMLGMAVTEIELSDAPAAKR